MADALIHLRVPAALKGRWVRLSREKGMRLTDWIITHTEASMALSRLKIAIPLDLRFADLRLTRLPGGDLSFETEPLTRIAAASGPHVEGMLSTEDGQCSLIAGWYRAARARGEPADPVAEDLTAEVEIEDAHGGGHSHQPGRA